MRKTNKERRLAIVKDAKKQIELGIFDSSPRTYVRLNTQLLGIEKDQYGLIINPRQGAQEVLLKATKPKSCKVCAKGALLLSCIRKENKYTIEETNHASNDGILEKLSKGGLFSVKNLDLIERFYEGWPNTEEMGDDKDQYTPKIEKFLEKYGCDPSTSKDRLLAIFRNMLRNDGIFKP